MTRHVILTEGRFREVRFQVLVNSIEGELVAFIRNTTTEDGSDRKVCFFFRNQQNDITRLYLDLDQKPATRLCWQISELIRLDRLNKTVTLTSVGEPGYTRLKMSIRGEMDISAPHELPFQNQEERTAYIDRVLADFESRMAMSAEELPNNNQENTESAEIVIPREDAIVSDGLTTETTEQETRRDNTAITTSNSRTVVLTRRNRGNQNRKEVWIYSPRPEDEIATGLLLFEITNILRARLREGTLTQNDFLTFDFASQQEAFSFVLGARCIIQQNSLKQFVFDWNTVELFKQYIAEFEARNNALPAYLRCDNPDFDEEV